MATSLWLSKKWDSEESSLRVKFFFQNVNIADFLFKKIKQTAVFEKNSEKHEAVK